MFPAWHIALTALVTAALTTIIAAGITAWRGARPTSSHVSGWSSRAVGDLLGVGIASGLAVLLWRLGANIPALNDDPIPGVSPANVLCAPLAFVGAETYVRLRMA